MTAPTTPVNFTDAVAELVTLLGNQHHPAIAGPEDVQEDARRMFRRFAQNYGRINSGTYDPDWTGILLQNVYDALATPEPHIQRGHLIRVAALCQAWAADIDRTTATEQD
jgi:hypothetical protein